MTPKDIKSLLSHLKRNNVQIFKIKDIEIQFFESQKLIERKEAIKRQESAETAKNLAETIKQQELNMPPDLRADDLMNADKIMNWSAAPESGEPVPLTGEDMI